MVDDFRDPRSSKSDDEDTEPSFVPPEAVAKDEDVIDMSDAASASKAASKKPSVSKAKKTAKLAAWFGAIKIWFSKLNKQQKIAVVAGVVIGLAIAGFGIYKLVTKPAPAAPAPVVKKEEVKEPPKPTTEASMLTGIQVAPELNQLPVIGVMIENSPDARPQSGLNHAGVVFEAIAEGGITRFLTLFQEAQPDYLGPVRSVRPYYIDWLKGFDAPIAHVGGSAEALARIRNPAEGIKDLDQSSNGGAFQRVSNRYAPHNVYTSLSSLLTLSRSKGFNSSNFTGFARKPEKAIAPATARVIDIAISGPLYNVHYDYDAVSNSYRRVMAGLPHVDERSGQQLSPKVVIAIVVPYSIHPNGVNSSYGTIGSGKAYIFQDGGVTEGTWSKSSDKDQIRFGDAKGAPIGLNPGQTWITAANIATNVVYAP